MSEGPGAAELANFLTGGWKGMSDAPAAAIEASAEMLQTRYETACIVKNGVSAGFLDWLRSRTVDQPAFVPGMGGTDSAYQGFLREGQNSIYREIVNQIAIAEAGPPNAGGAPAKKSTAKKGK